MTELEAAQAIRDGLLPSPWKHENMTLFAVRVTGTGMSYRDSLDEYVWRDPKLYLNDEFIARVSGLPLIWEHPKKGSLNSDEFHDRIIGSLMFGYVKNDSEVWGVARVYDDAAITLMSEGQLSTSPGVVFKSSDGNTKIDVDGDKHLLIEGKPSTLCHLAVCENGVWDKGQDPTGVQNDTLTSESQETVRMAEEDKRDDAAKMDAKLDAIMDSLKSAHSRMDAMEADSKSRKDAEEKERAEREDAARKDAARKDRCDKHRADRFGSRKDGECKADWDKRHDADEEAMCDAMRKDGAEEEEAREDARKARHDAEEKERADGGESFEKWAKEEAKEEEHKDSKKNARKDGEDEPKEEEMKPDARHDAAAGEIAELKRQLAAMKTEMGARFTPVSPEERNALATAQARADGVAGLFGKRASGPIAGESSLEYRRRVAADFKQHSARFKDVTFDGMTPATFATIEEIIYADAAAAARTGSDHAGAGILIPVREQDASGRTITRYTGDNMSWMAPFMSSGRVGRFVDPRKQRI